MEKPLYCLLIDDDDDDKEFFNRALRNVDPEILLQYSPSGSDAIKNLKAGHYKPDYIFLDLNMMPMSGIESLAEIKTIASCADTPVIIYSTLINENIKYRTLSLGAFDHYQKPASQKDLEIYLKTILQIE
ncbi:MAG: response regulator [Bacteroidota bacterium]